MSVFFCVMLVWALWTKPAGFTSYWKELLVNLFGMFYWSLSTINKGKVDMLLFVKGNTILHGLNVFHNSPWIQSSKNILNKLRAADIEVMGVTKKKMF